eukprot:gb/GEZN01010011.1/.p1 GENE.gb/GEZN01010011.1/~~gb/GEZN01010011.1/.p1  ORF type:complete len:380 (+),score=47.27 gb/GEZN01010011.1/:3-1142(+)
MLNRRQRWSMYYLSSWGWTNIQSRWYHTPLPKKAGVASLACVSLLILRFAIKVTMAKRRGKHLNKTIPDQCLSRAGAVCTEVSFPSAVPGISLAGTLTRPAQSSGNLSAVLLITGSGKIDRDTAPLYTHSPMVAALVTRCGVITLTFDKRGAGKSQGVFKDVGFYDNMEDVRAALTWLKAQDGVDPARLIAVGHSEGSMHAAAMLAENRVCGAVMLGAVGSTGREIVTKQGVAVYDNIGGLFGLLVRALRPWLIRKQQQAINNPKAALWLREFLDYSPAQSLRQAKLTPLPPLLAITGSNDVQTVPSELSVIREAAEAKGSYVKVVELEGMTHFLRRGTKDITNMFQQLAAPADERMLDLLVSFVTACDTGAFQKAKLM